MFSGICTFKFYSHVELSGEKSLEKINQLWRQNNMFQLLKILKTCEILLYIHHIVGQLHTAQYELADL